MSPSARAILYPVAIFGVVTVGLLALVAWQLHGYAQDNVGGWNLAFNILTARASPFGTAAGGWAVVLAVWGFLLIPAVAGAVAGLVLGAYLSGEQSVLERNLDISNRRIAKLAVATRNSRAKKEDEKAAKQADAEKAQAQADEAEAKARTAAAESELRNGHGSGPGPSHQTPGPVS
jgi:hypothetical protein